MTMLLTLSTRSLMSLLPPHGDGSLNMLRVPEFTSRQLRLRGLNVVASMLAGWSLEQLDQLRDQADKAACPCLVLIEDAPLPLADEDPAKRQQAQERMTTLATAAHRLACNSLAIRCDAPDTDEAFEQLAQEVRQVMPKIERFELTLLIKPSVGLTSTPDRLTELIKRIGGFRIGSMPSFQHAASTDDPIYTLRQLAPYAGAIQATVDGFSESGEHKAYDLVKFVNAVRSVGFANALAIDYTGNGNAVSQIDHAREILEKALEAELE